MYMQPKTTTFKVVTHDFNRRVFTEHYIFTLCQIPVQRGKENPSYFPSSTSFSCLSSVNPQWSVKTVQGRFTLSLQFTLVQDPAPKFPAFSATSSALFRFWSKSSHLKITHMDIRGHKQLVKWYINWNITGHQQLLKCACTWLAFPKNRMGSLGQNLSRFHKSSSTAHRCLTVVGQPAQ